MTTPPTPPTARQLEVHAFMLAFFDQYSLWPTLREICTAFGFNSTNSAAQVLLSLERKGMATHRPKSPRSWIAIEAAP